MKFGDTLSFRYKECIIPAKIRVVLDHKTKYIKMVFVVT